MATAMATAMAMALAGALALATPTAARRTGVSAMRVAVVMVNWNARDVMMGALRSLEAGSTQGGLEVVVVDNGSTDGSVELLGRELPWVQVIANPTNRGLPAANNQGLLATSAEAVVICNPDVIFAPGAIEAMVELMQRQPRAGMVIPRLRYSDGRLQTSAGDLPSLADALLGRQTQRRRARPTPDTTSTQSGPSGFWWDGWAHDEERPIGRGHEAAYLVRRSAVTQVGLQDERFPLDWEGIDWTARFRACGWDVWLCPSAEVVHLGGASIRQVPFRWVVSSHRGMYRYFAKRRPAYWRPVLAVVIGARGALKLAATAAGAAMYERGHRDRPPARPPG